MQCEEITQPGRHSGRTLLFPTVGTAEFPLNKVNYFM